MKILRIYLKNLNSLRGEFTIDLEKEPFFGAGIFAITGPTGAGKSTILDAITLALYGRAARYDNKPNPENMMSRGTGECEARVEFEVAKGRYIASWHMKRARGKPDGKLQPVQRYVNESQGKTIAQKVSEADKIIEDLTGLDVDRFFRSVLLAQGDFVKFLKAAPDDRATLLESLTGTGIYSEISIRAHGETVKRENTLKVKEDKLNNTKLLTTEEQESLVKQVDELKVGIETNTQEQAKLAHLIAQGNKLKEWLKKQADLKVQLEAIQQEGAVWETDFKRLDRFQRGMRYFPDLSDLETLQKKCQDSKCKAGAAEKAVAIALRELRAGVDATAGMIREQLAKTDLAIREASQKRGDLSAKIDAVNSWLELHKQDQNLDVCLSPIVEMTTSLSFYRGEAKKIADSHSVLRKQLEDARENIHHLNNLKEEALVRLQGINLAVQTCDQELLERLQGKAAEQLQNELNALERLLAFLDTLQEKENKLKALNESIQQLTTASEDALKNMTEGEAALRSMQEKLKAMKDMLDEKRLLAGLHEHREKLEEGKPCPLCGSTDHPYTRTLEISISSISTLEHDLNQLEKEIKKQESEVKQLVTASAKSEATLKIKTEEFEKISLQAKSIRETLAGLNPLYSENLKKIELQENLSTTRSHLTFAKENKSQKDELLKTLVKAQHEVEMANKNITSQDLLTKDRERQLNDTENTLHKTKAEITDLENTLLKHLESFGMISPPYGEEKQLLAKLEKRKRAFLDQRELSANLQIELGKLANDNVNREQHRNHLEKQFEDLNTFIKSHELHLVDSSPQDTFPFCARYKTLEDAQDGLKKLESTLIKVQSTLEDSKMEFADAQEIYSRAEEKLSTELLKTEFETIDAFKAARLAPDEEDRIKRKKEQLKTTHDQIHGQSSQIEAELSDLKQSDAPQGDRLLEIQNTFNELGEKIIEMRKAFVLAEKELEMDRENRIRYAALSLELEADRKQLAIWQKLAALIGSHDGKAFRKFAQGLSLDLLIKHANQHLSLLSNRYRLKRTLGEQLDLEIQDMHQANATRPTASLSGGESFLTSLALALGLSDLAGKNVRIDSLFIDEGFGSLDPETLEIAVQALESLRSKNKTIGVISHIELLKERIPTQISIEKGPGGISTLSIVTA